MIAKTSHANVKMATDIIQTYKTVIFLIKKTSFNLTLIWVEFLGVVYEGGITLTPPPPPSPELV